MLTKDMNNVDLQVFLAKQLILSLCQYMLTLTPLNCLLKTIQNTAHLLHFLSLHFLHYLLAVSYDFFPCRRPLSSQCYRRQLVHQFKLLFMSSPNQQQARTCNCHHCWSDGMWETLGIIFTKVYVYWLKLVWGVGEGGVLQHSAAGHAERNSHCCCRDA